MSAAISAFHAIAPQMIGAAGQGAVDAEEKKDGDSAFGIMSSVMTAFGAISEAHGKSTAYKSNAWMLEQDSIALERRGMLRLGQAKDSGRMLLARQVAAVAASGRGYSGSALDVMARSERTSLLEQQMIQEDIIYGKANLKNKAAMMRANASIAKSAGYANAVSSLLSSGASASAAVGK